MKPLSISIVLLIFSNFSKSVVAQQHNFTTAGAKSAAMSTIGVTFQDIYSGLANQAGLAYLTNTSFAIFGEQRFLMEELNNFAAIAALPTKSGTYGLTIQHFGFEAYNEQKIGLAYGRKLSKNLAIGVQLDYLNTRIADYGNQGNLTFEVGLQTNITKKLRLGVHVFSPISIKITPDDVIPTIFKLGLAYAVSEKLVIVTEIEKDIVYKPIVKLGVDYKMVEKFSLRLGVGSNPIRNSLGIGIHLKNMTIDIASSFHQVLGFTPSIAVVYHLEK